MKRRSFIKYTSLFSAPLMIGGFPISSIARSASAGMVNEESDRILILVQLNGGNDGLSMLTPLDQYDALANLRSNILVPQSKLLAIGNNLSFHPSMIGIRQLYDDAKIKIIQSVGYPEQNRSHFRSLDIWHAGSDANQYLNTGWLGRYLDSQYPGFPEQYPNEEYKDPFAITIGSVVSETCQGMASNFSMTLVDPNNLTQLSSPVNNSVAEGCGAAQLDFLVSAIEQTNEYGDRIQEAYDSGNNLSTKYNDNNRLSSQLKTVARLISGGLQSKIYIVNLGGFDTHADQVQGTDPHLGDHADLLATLSDAISAFQDDIERLNLKDRVLGMTYSEFGRRIRSNFSLGTDHGDAAPLILFGNCINAGITGQNPAFPGEISQNDAVPMQYDFRSVYGSVLMDWFGTEETVVKSIFTHDFQYLPITYDCALSSAVNEKEVVKSEVRIYPNPSSSSVTIEFQHEGGGVNLSLFDQTGRQIKSGKLNLSSGLQQLPFDISYLPPGHYFVKIQTHKIMETQKFIKI